MIRAANQFLFIDFPPVFPTGKAIFSTGSKVFGSVWLTSVENLIPGDWFG